MTNVCLGPNPVQPEGDLVLMDCDQSEDKIVYLNLKGQIIIQTSLLKNKRCLDYSQERRKFFVVSCKNVSSRFEIQTMKSDRSMWLWKYVALEGAAKGDHVTIDYYDYF